MRQIEVINQETIIDVSAEVTNVEILVYEPSEELAEKYALEAQQAAIAAEASATSASGSATTATNQANIATNQALLASAARLNAQNAANAASDSEDAAALSASSALASATSAELDAIATAADRVQTGLDRQATWADRVQTGLDRVATGADRVQTGIDANTATTQAGIATTQAGIATTQAGIATTQAGNALTSANNALNSANAAAASAASAAQVGTSTLLTGFSVGGNTAIAPTDSILQGFNKTQGQLNARPVISGTPVAGQVAFWNAANTQAGDSGLVWDSTNKRFSINSASSQFALNARTSGNGTTFGSNIVARFEANGLNFNSSIQFSDNVANSAIIGLVGNSLAFGFGVIERWRITNGGILQAAGAQTIQTATGQLTITTGNNGNIQIVPNGTGLVMVGNGIPTASLDVNGTCRIRTGVSLADTSGNVLIGTLTDAGFRLDVNGTARVQGSVTLGTVGTGTGFSWDNTNNRLGLRGIASPVGALDINTGSSNLFNISGQLDGSISFGNISSSAQSPAILGKSNSFTGIHIMSLTANNNTLSDMIFSSRVNNNSDFSTLTNVAFDFRRFATSLFTILRNGSTGILTTTPTNTLDVNGTTRIRTLSNATGDFVSTNADGVLARRTPLQSITDMSSAISGWNASIRQRLEHTTAGVLEWVNV